MNYVYLVIFKWSVEDDSGTDIKVFETYYDAREYSDKLIEDENNADLSWVGSEVFNENGETNEDFSLYSSLSHNANRYQYWRVIDERNDNRYSEIYLFREPIIRRRKENV